MHTTLPYSEHPTLQSELSRRTLLKGIALAVASGALLASKAELAALVGSIPASEPLQRSTFAAMRGQAFHFAAGGAPATLQLADVRDLATASANHAQRFALWFRGPVGLALEQDTYTVMHRTLGEFSLFIVPMQQPNGGTWYEAIFNS